MRQKNVEREVQKQERIQAEAFRRSFQSKQAQADSSRAAKQDQQREILLFPIPKAKAMQTGQPSELREETAYEAVQRNTEACKRKLEVVDVIHSNNDKVESVQKVDRSTLEDFCKDMSDEEIRSNRETVPTWGLTKEAAIELLRATQAKQGRWKLQRV